MRLSLTEYQGSRGALAVEVSLDGIAALSDAGPLRRVLRRLLQQGYSTVLVNVCRLHDMDRACWNHLVSAARILRQKGGRMVLRHCPDALKQQLAAQHWEGVFEVSDADDILGLPAKPCAARGR